MTNDKKLIIKRIIIFYILSILPLAVITPIMNSYFGEPIFTGETKNHSAVALYGILGMTTPTIANIITRLITKEGLKESYLSISMKNGKWKYYVLSFIIPLVYGFIGFILITNIFCSNMSDIINTADININIWTIISCAGLILFMIFPYFGEEFGWRAYLTPKLSKLFGEPVGILINGVLWGLWHTPLTLSGHNFGIDYKGFPFLGILLMCLMCICLSPLLTLLTKRTESVFPASIVHAINNNASAMVILTLIANESVLIKVSEIEIIKLFFVMIVPMAIAGIISYIILLNDYRKEKCNK